VGGGAGCQAVGEDGRVLEEQDRLAELLPEEPGRDAVRSQAWRKPADVNASRRDRTWC